MKRAGPNYKLPRPRSSWFAMVRLLALAGLGLSAYLLWGSLSQDALPGCGPESGCNVVLHSRWSSWFGVPVSAFALLIYALVLGRVATWRRSSDAVADLRVWNLLAFAGVALAGAALWFTGLQLLVLRTICPFCMLAHACGLATAILLLTALPRRNKGKVRAHSRATPAGLPSASLARSGAGALLAVLILAGGQVLQPFKTYEVGSMGPTALRPTQVVGSPGASPTVEAQTQPAAASAAPEVSRPPRRLLPLHDAVFSLDLDEVPLHGSPEAKHVIVHLFDYSCKHCRQLHPILTEASHGLSNQLAIVSLPVPLDAQCNPLIKSPTPDHIHACAYARTGLAVWRANREKMDAFEAWIFAPVKPPPPEEVRAEAMRLVGTNAFERAMRDPWIDQQLQTNIRLYETNYVRYRKSRLPAMMIGTNIVNGVPPNIGTFYRFLATQFDLQLPLAQ